MNTSPFEQNYSRPPQQPVPVYQQRQQIINQYPTQPYNQNPQIIHHPQHYPTEHPHSIPMGIQQTNYQPNVPQNYGMVQSMQHHNIHNYPQGQQIPQYEQTQMHPNTRQPENEQ